MRNIDWWNDKEGFNYIRLYIKRFDFHFSSQKVGTYTYIPLQLCNNIVQGYFLTVFKATVIQHKSRV